MLLSDYLKIGESLENIGVFDPILDKDNAFFINIQRLKETTTPEFEAGWKLCGFQSGRDGLCGFRGRGGHER